MVNKVNKPTISTSITIAADDKDAPNVHFVYVCKKMGGMIASSKEK